MSATLAPAGRLFSLVQTAADDSLTFPSVKVPADGGRPQLPAKIPGEVARWVLERLALRCGEVTTLDGSQWRLTDGGPEWIALPVKTR